MHSYYVYGGPIGSSTSMCEAGKLHVRIGLNTAWRLVSSQARCLYCRTQPLERNWQRNLAFIGIFYNVEKDHTGCFVWDVARIDH